MKLVLDAMGGDYAPEQIVKGALEAAADIKGTIILVGDPDRIRPHLGANPPANVTI
ncbi:MAG TPA: phosphate acyltransferase, partial [Armatimonadetes bacterium]|nr:phosphate acyltransferase [Armatimonadota bacterium]